MAVPKVTVHRHRNDFVATFYIVCSFECEQKRLFIQRPSHHSHMYTHHHHFNPPLYCL